MNVFEYEEALCKLIYKNLNKKINIAAQENDFDAVHILYTSCKECFSLSVLIKGMKKKERYKAKSKLDFNKSETNQLLGLLEAKTKGSFDKIRSQHQYLSELTEFNNNNEKSTNKVNFNYLSFEYREFCKYIESIEKEISDLILNFRHFEKYFNDDSLDIASLDIFVGTLFITELYGELRNSILRTKSIIEKFGYTEEAHNYILFMDREMNKAKKDVNKFKKNTLKSLGVKSYREIKRKTEKTCWNLAIRQHIEDITKKKV